MQEPPWMSWTDLNALSHLVRFSIYSQIYFLIGGGIEVLNLKPVKAKSKWFFFYSHCRVAITGYTQTSPPLLPGVPPACLARPSPLSSLSLLSLPTNTHTFCFHSCASPSPFPPPVPKAALLLQNCSQSGDLLLVRQLGHSSQFTDSWFIQVSLVPNTGTRSSPLRPRWGHRPFPSGLWAKHKYPQKVCPDSTTCLASMRTISMIIPHPFINSPVFLPVFPAA